jgi:microsomal epoxide hydrolase
MPQPAGMTLESLTDKERVGVERGNQFMNVSSAYAREHGSRPATIGLVLGSNPLALLAWCVAILGDGLVLDICLYKFVV